MFGSNNKSGITAEHLEETLAPLVERIDKLEAAVKKQAETMVKLEQQLKSATKTTSISLDLANAQTCDETDNASPEVQHSPIHATERERAQTASCEASASKVQTYFLPAPTSEGLFLESSNQEQVGKSIYQLRTEDGINGRFTMLSTPDAIATATISISQFVKPACRIEGNTHQVPRQIENVEEGVAQKDGNVWKVVSKAKVLFL